MLIRNTCCAASVLFLALVIVPTFSRPALAETLEGWPHISDYWSVQLENDFFSLSGDQHYTNGIEITRLKAGTGPKWLSGLGRLLPFFQLDEEGAAYTYSLGQKVFTPEDLTRTDLITDDRPYAGYLFFRTALLSRTYRSEDMEGGNILEISLGTIGPNAGAESAMKRVHQLVDSETPMGWDNQLSNEPTLGISYARLWSIIQPGPGSLQFGIIPHLTAQLGNVYTYGAGGVIFRLGNNLRTSFSPPTIRPGFPGVCYFRSSQTFSWYLFGGHESRWVFKDIFLDGNTFKDSHSVKRENLVGDYQFGLSLHKGALRVSLSNVYRTKEFEEQKELTRFGALNLSFSF